MILMKNSGVPIQTQIHGIMFDLDGTLVDSRRDLTTAINYMRQDFDLSPLPFDLITSYIGNGARKLVERSLHNTSVDVAQGLDCFKSHYQAHLADETICYPEVPETLVSLKHHGIKCAIITNKPESPTRALLTALGIDMFFDPITGGDTYPWFKPDPYPLITVMKHWELNSNQVLMVGDHMTDIAAADSAGVRSVFLSSGFGRLGVNKPDITLCSISELLVLTGIVS